MRSLTIFVLLLFVSMNTMAQLKFIAHRGASYYAPENSLAAIKLAWELGADGSECDIQLTKDNQVVLWHDGNTERLTGQKLEVAKTDYSELSKLEICLSQTNSTYFEGERIPLLKDVLKATPKGQLLVIEIKCGNEIFPELQKVIKDYWKTGNIAFIGFNFETITLAKANFPEVPCYYLSSSKEDVLKRIPDIKKNKLDGVDLNSKIIDQQLVDELQKADAEIWCWTVDTVMEAMRMKNLGVKTITTNRPTWLKEQM
ncbi:MAG TPA: glycerophosphodiester phosphodiesterase family protein [Prolixibacteraceae bacterium]|nr:glycerophosphodiester phosphodiesterase family protein [Prolixibacteraceae bacterium]